MSVEGIFKGITRAKKEGNSIEGTGGQKRGQTRNCNLPSFCPATVLNCCTRSYRKDTSVQSIVSLVSALAQRIQCKIYPVFPSIPKSEQEKKFSQDKKARSLDEQGQRTQAGQAS